MDNIYYYYDILYTDICEYKYNIKICLTEWISRQMIRSWNVFRTLFGLVITLYIT